MGYFADMRWLVLIAVIILGHVGLWLSDMDPALKWRLTLINVAGWTVILAPALLVGRWLKAVERRNDEAKSGKSERS